MEILNVEVVLKRSSVNFAQDAIAPCTKYLESSSLKPGEVESKFDNWHDTFLRDNIDYIIIGELSNYTPVNTLLARKQVEISWFVYTLDQNGPQYETVEDNSGENINLSTHYVLPSQCIHGTWENLIYDKNIKSQVLKYAHTMMYFSQKNVNHNIVSCNRVILLHGPPGTGKTSLCKALAQKLSIQMQDTYKQSILMEINSHSLFSKWFSESGKLVTKMFTQIIEILEDPRILVCVLIDEVESLAHAREKCMSGNEPSDSLRAVNALLTEIDKLKRFPNVLILTTSNLTSCIDVAFVDRADIKQFIGLPSCQAIYQIFFSCVQELVKAKIIHPAEELCPFFAFRDETDFGSGDSAAVEHSKDLLEICKKTVGLSGRTLRKIPFIAHALYVNTPQVTMKKFLQALNSAVDYEKTERNHFQELTRIFNGD